MAACPASSLSAMPCAATGERHQSVQGPAVEQVPPSRSASNRLTVPLPEPLGPSTAMIGAVTASLGSGPSARRRSDDRAWTRTPGTTCRRWQRRGSRSARTRAGSPRQTTSRPGDRRGCPRRAADGPPSMLSPSARTSFGTPSASSPRAMTAIRSLSLTRSSRARDHRFTVAQGGSDEECGKLRSIASGTRRSGTRMPRRRAGRTSMWRRARHRRCGG